MAQMTVQEVRERVAAIKNADDDEQAHAREDELHQDVLQHFADLGHDIAIEALKTREIDFSRWCA